MRQACWRSHRRCGRFGARPREERLVPASRPAQDQGDRHDRTGLRFAGDDQGADPGRHERGPPELLPRHARGAPQASRRDPPGLATSSTRTSRRCSTPRGSRSAPAASPAARSRSAPASPFTLHTDDRLGDAPRRVDFLPQAAAGGRARLADPDRRRRDRAARGRRRGATRSAARSRAAAGSATARA